MAHCCDNDGCGLNALRQRQRRTLLAVFWINALMFAIMLFVALLSQSTSLFADSFDNFGDAFTYAISLYAIQRSQQTKARVALLKGVLILLAAVLVIVQIIRSLMLTSVPVFELMGVFSALALLANSICVWLLWRHREDDINMSSVWECARNDIAANLSVLLAAVLVWLSGERWPDTLIAVGLAILLLRSGFGVVQRSRQQLHASA